VLKRGCCWVIGDGSKVSVMGEPWIRGEGGKWLSLPQGEEVYDLYVNRLMVERERDGICIKFKLYFQLMLSKLLCQCPFSKQLGWTN
jgi:hypothetical protein